jgi:hypothetical protein
MRSLARRSFLLTISLSLALLACGGQEPVESEARSDSASSVYTLDSENVPPALRNLVPLARVWGIGDDVERMEHIQRSSPADRQALESALAPYHGQITAWLDSFEPGSMTDEAAAFMYMQLALEEMP